MILEEKVGDTTMHAWMMEFLNNCVREVDGRDQIDISMTYRMVQSEPKRADEAIQIWAQDLHQELAGQPVKLSSFAWCSLLAQVCKVHVS